MGACSIIAINSDAIMYGLAGEFILFLACLILTMARRG